MDIPAPDVNTDSEMMAWMMDTYSMGKGYCVPGVVTGKPVAIGGTLGRSSAVGRGVATIAREICDRRCEGIAGTTIAVQGFGKVGYSVAEILHETGAKIIGISDTKGGIYNENGVDPGDLVKHKKETGSVINYPGATTVDADEILTMDCDVLVPAALENAITERNAEKIKAKLIVEGSNAPTTLKADKILEEGNVLVVPDILANAGGVVVSYFEWVQDIQSFFWKEDEINRRLEEIMIGALNDVYKVSEDYNTNLRGGAYILAISKMAEAVKTRGLYP